MSGEGTDESELVEICRIGNQFHMSEHEENFSSTVGWPLVLQIHWLTVTVRELGAKIDRLLAEQENK